MILFITTAVKTSNPTKEYKLQVTGIKKMLRKSPVKTNEVNRQQKILCTSIHVI
jgi:hypothetical protein